jgi:MFS family permease
VRAPFFYGWIIVALGFIAEFLAYGMRTSFSVFYVAILREFGWTRADTALILSAGLVAYGLMAPISGALIDHFGPRKIMPIGVLCLAAGMAASSRANTIRQFGILFALVSIGTCLTGFVPYTAILSRWFVAKRGQVFGLLNAGFGVSFLLVFITGYLISNYGWQASYVILAALVTIVLFPMEVILLRNHPSEMGQQPDGITSPAGGVLASRNTCMEVSEKASVEWSLAQALRTYRFWAILLANVTFWGIAQQLLIAHQVAFAVDLGVGTAVASAIAAVFGIMTAVGALGGHLSDRIGRERCFTLGCSIAGLGVMLLIASRYLPSIWLLYGYAVIIGLGLGIAGPALTSSTADLFAGRHFGSISGAIMMGFSLGGSVAPWLGGFIFDTTGEYTLAFFVVLVALFLAVGFVWVAGPRQVRLMSELHR